MHICHFCVFIVLTPFHPVLSIRLTSPNETDLAQTEEPYTGPDPWTEIPCDFDGYVQCGWTNEHGVPDDFDWRLGEGRDSHRNRRKQKTGVKTDHGRGGGYMYIQSGRSRNRTAKLTTGFFKLTQPGCLKFYYHMRGRHMGHLKLYEFVTPRKVRPDFERQMDKYRTLWAVYGNQGQFWQLGVVPISDIDPSLRIRLVFEAFDWDAGIAGNIILDDISFDPIQAGVTCNFSPSGAAPPETTTTSVSTTAPCSTTTPVNAMINMTNATAKAKSPIAVNTTIYQTSLQSLGSTSTSHAATDEEFSLVTTASSQSTSSAARTEGPINNTTLTTKNGREKKPTKDDPVIYIIVGIVCAILVVMVALLLYWRHKKRNQFTYYDNCTVHMTRMTQDTTDPKDAVMQYYKLTDSDVKY